MLDYSKIKKIKVGNHDMWIYNGELSGLSNSEWNEYVRYINSQHNKEEGTKMSKKFTEEQYQKIVNTYESSSDYVDAIKLVLNYIDGLNWLGYDEALAIANPLTREWAHDKFVEKEKKYRWIGKKLDQNRKHMILYRDINGAIRVILVHENGNQDKDEQLTESEIREWGYNPEMFDKEEV